MGLPLRAGHAQISQHSLLLSLDKAKVIKVTKRGMRVKDNARHDLLRILHESLSMPCQRHDALLLLAEHATQESIDYILPLLGKDSASARVAAIRLLDELGRRHEAGLSGLRFLDVYEEHTP